MVGILRDSMKPPTSWKIRNLREASESCEANASPLKIQTNSAVYVSSNKCMVWIDKLLKKYRSEKNINIFRIPRVRLERCQTYRFYFDSFLKISISRWSMWVIAMTCIFCRLKIVREYVSEIQKLSYSEDAKQRALESDHNRGCWSRNLALS